MADREARALGAGEQIEVDGETFHLHPIDVGILQEVSRAALDSYKKNFIQTYIDSAALMANSKGDALLEKKLDEAARMIIGDIPKKSVYGVDNIKITDALKEMLRTIYDELPETDLGIKGLLLTALDSEKVTPEKIKEITNKRPIKVQTPYDNWWVTASIEGMVTFIYASITADNGSFTKKDLSKWPLNKLSEAARIVEKLTAPSMENI